MKLFLLLALSLASSFLPPLAPPTPTIALHYTRRAALTTLIGASPFLAMAPALAEKASPFETCTSLCVYECTKPKEFNDQKSRPECLQECKIRCRKEFPKTAAAA